MLANACILQDRKTCKLLYTITGLLLGRVELKSKHTSELFEFYMFQVFGKHISRIVVGRYPYNINSLLFDQITYIVELHINVFGASFLYWIRGNKNATFVICANLSWLYREA